MKTDVLVKCDEKVQLTGKTIIASSDGDAKSSGRAAEAKRVSDPFFEIKSPRAAEGDKVTVTFAHC